MMRKGILVLTGILILLLSGGLNAKDKPAGKVVGDTLYQDLKYDFTLKIQEGWKIGKIRKLDDINRVTITKISPVMPIKYNDHPEYFTAPKLTVLADTNTVSLDSLDTLIRNREGKVKIVKQALKDFMLMTYSRYRPQFNPPIRLKYKDFNGLIIQCRKQMDAADFIRGAIFVLQNDKLTLLVESIAELERFGFNERDFESMVKSIRMAEPPKEPEKNETAE
jgi:hypothetical protein